MVITTSIYLLYNINNINIDYDNIYLSIYIIIILIIIAYAIDIGIYMHIILLVYDICVYMCAKTYFKCILPLLYLRFVNQSKFIHSDEFKSKLAYLKQIEHPMAPMMEFLVSLSPESGEHAQQMVAQSQKNRETDWMFTAENITPKM